ncbi:chromobox protein homolog 1a isoform X1 [Scomber scombrus]|uniref:Chromobox protein homolog 1a isoform X1 n=1 Tax=Scomber scombrus TaxID=13677 RepID=A0AAV1Q0G5_SCOSC
MPKDSRAARKRMRDTKRLVRASESDESRIARLASNAVRNAHRRAEETPERRAERLASNATYIAKRRAEERWERDLQHYTRMQEEQYLAQLAERQARNTMRHHQVHCAQLEHDNTDLFQEEFQGNYIS